MKKSAIILLLVFTVFFTIYANAMAASLHYFGVCQTDANGDVSFRYTGARQFILCINYLPWLAESPNPNNWNGWALTNWLPKWKGQKLLVPRRYQIWHQNVYGYPISQALYLVSLY